MNDFIIAGFALLLIGIAAQVMVAYQFIAYTLVLVWKAEAEGATKVEASMSNRSMLYVYAPIILGVILLVAGMVVS